ncbi:cytochrome c oxidase subunit IV-domain-containing protein [Hysterangium stoloniferum]|nr:cytochrome c oxidase subunit IV-domain-containing protein [Hysterangium stoloniferum]
MHALRLARTHLSLRAAGRRASTASHSHPTINSQPSLIPLSNVEAQWETLTKQEKVDTALQLEELQKKDWKQLSLDEKKAIYYVAYGPHGPRTPKNPPGTAIKVLLGTMGLLGVSGLAFQFIRSQANPPPKSMTKEWQEASNERAIAQKINPLTGISSEGYKGKGFISVDK